MYKEFRELTRADAVKSLYQDMAARHRARFRSIHVCCFNFVQVLLELFLIESTRSSVWLKLKRPTTFAVLTLGNFSNLVSNSLCLTVWPDRARLLLPSVPSPFNFEVHVELIVCHCIMFVSINPRVVCTHFFNHTNIDLFIY